MPKATITAEELPDTAEQPMSRTARKRADKIAQIESVAAEVFAEKGFERANFDDIAAALDLRGSSLFHYFSSKSELYRRILEHASAAVADRLGAVIDQPGTAQELWARLVREQVLIQTRDYPAFAPLFYKANTGNDELQELVLQLRREHAAIFERVAKRWQAETGRDAADVRVRIGITFGALAYLPEWYRPSGRLGVEEMADRMARELALEPAGGRPSGG